MSERIYAKRKPYKCPQCGEKPVARIQYGYPMDREQLKLDIAAGKVVLGGCMMDITNPHWQCSFCNFPIYREQDREDIEQAFREMDLLEQ